MSLPVRKVPSKVAEEISASRGLHSYLVKLDQGRPGTPRSWLYENKAADQVLLRWLMILARETKLDEFGSEFREFDLKQVEKFGQQGIVPPVSSEEAQAVLEPLYEPSKYDNEYALSSWFKHTYEFAKFLFGSKIGTKVRRTFKQVVDSMRERDTLNTNSGFERFAERQTVVEDEVADAATGKAFTKPAVLLFRHYNGKLRPVWMYPMSMNILENQFAHEIQDSLRSSENAWVRAYLSPWVGFDTVKSQLTAMWPQPSPIVGGDTTKMDANMRKAQLRLVYEVVKWLFREEEWNQLYRVMMQVNTIPLLIGTDKWLVGPHGLASGSGWTQLTETVLQMFMAWLRKFRGMGIGDDFTWLSGMTAEELVAYLDLFGLPANEKKQDVGRIALTFLQRYFRQGFFSREDRKVLGAYYPTIRALNSMVWPERFHKPKLWNSDMFCVRIFMILENCVDDPCFASFVKFVVHGQKDLIPFAKKNSAELAEIQAAARKVPGLWPSYNQEKKDKPLSEFYAIRIARVA